MAKRYKDFIAIKFSDHERTRAGRRRKNRRHRSEYNPPVALRLPHMGHREQARYAAYSPVSHQAVDGEPGWRCDTRGCRNHGFGPMLRSLIWRRHFSDVRFMCEPCMVRRLGRPLNRYDLRNCLMNLSHPAFDLDLHTSL